MKNGHQSVLNIFWKKSPSGESSLYQKVQIVYEDGTSEIVEKEVEGEITTLRQPSFSDRFKHDTFQPHNSKEVTTEVITKKMKVDINTGNMTPQNILKNIERGIRIDNLMRKMLNTPEIIKEKGFDFKGNDELKKAMTLICYELGGEWADVPSFFK